MFYIQPPRGLITLHILEEVVFSRLEYLNMLNNNEQSFNGKFEYLLEGSYDCVGHFTLRLLTAKSSQLFLFWLGRETLLLKKRLSLIHPRQLYKLFRTIFRHVKKRQKDINPVDNVLLETCSFYLSSNIFRHISKNHREDCTEYYHKIDFELIPDLVEIKAVDLIGGLAIVYCSQWKQVLHSLFQTYILYETKIQDKLINHVLMDPRLYAIYEKVEHCLVKKGYNFGTITASNINEEAFHFPPCMENLHFQLRCKHRLSHYARFYYTLFLKECGMSLQEALIYWQSEYSKPHSCASLCIHDWQTDAKKFIYSIRHMYGLEGGRKNYATPNCASICDGTSGSNYEGGCPFKNFDKDSLKSLLYRSLDINKVDQFLMTVVKDKPQDSCANFFKLKSSSQIKNITITKPVQYYMKMTKFN